MIAFYTYLHCKPNGEPFYVGKGHGRRSHFFSNRGVHHKNVVAKYGKENIKIFIFPCDSEQRAFDDEIIQIAQLRRAGYELVNKTSGGDGISGFHHSDETRKKMSMSQKGRKQSPETIAKAAANNKAGTPEVRAKISAAHKGKKLSAEHRENIGKSLRGRIGKKHTEETKEKLRIARKSQVITDETREKLSVKAKADWAKRKAIISAMQNTQIKEIQNGK